MLMTHDDRCPRPQRERTNYAQSSGGRWSSGACATEGDGHATEAVATRKVSLIGHRGVI